MKTTTTTRTGLILSPILRTTALLCVSIVLATSIPSQVQADSLAEQVAKCGALESNLRRLECYDALAPTVHRSGQPRLPTPLPAVSATPATTAAPAPKLRRVSILSKNPIPFRKTKVRPQLIIECRPTSWQASVIIGEKLGRAPFTVSTRFDAGVILSGDWQLTSDGRGLVIPEAETIARVSIKHKTFEMKVVGREIPVLRFSFDVQNAREGIQQLREQCG